MARLVKTVHKRPIATRNLTHGSVPGNLLGPPIHKRLPKYGATDGKSNEASGPRCRLKPLVNFFSVFASAQNDAPNFVATSPMCNGYDSLAVLATVEPFDLPDVRFDACILQFTDGLDHQPWAQF
jgi:hypothetical protein